MDAGAACRGCEHHTEACGWPTTNERRRDRCGLPKTEAHIAVHGWHCPGWHREPHAVRPGELAADHPVPLVLGGEPLPAQPGVLCASCNARKGLNQRRR